jgi:uncharacterized membrane protein YbhN (UPF0104 family)
METDKNDTAADEKNGIQEAPLWRRTAFFLFRFAVSLILIYVIFRSVDLHVFTAVVASPKLLPVLAMVVFSLFFVFLGGLKLWVLFRGISPIDPWLFIGYYFLAGSVGSLAPAIFGDATLVGLAKRSRIPFHKSIPAILVDRFITLVIALFIFTPFTLVFVLPVSAGEMFLMTAAVFVLFAGFFWISIRFAPFLLDRFAVTKRFRESFPLFFNQYRPNLYINFLISTLRAVVSGLTLIYALMAAGVGPPFFATVCISNSLSVLTHIPVSLSGLGLFEGGGLVLFEAIGLNREEVLAGLLYHRMYIIIWAALTSLVLTLFFAKNKGDGSPFRSKKN